MSLAPYSKAIAAFFGTAAPAIAAALLPVSPGGSVIVVAEWLTIASTAVVATIAVFAAPANKPDTDTEPPLRD